MDVQTITLGGKKYAVIEAKEYRRLRALARAGEDEFPPLPPADASGYFPAVEYSRAGLARKIIRERRAAGLTQADLARRAGSRPETLNRIERGKATPDVPTVMKITRAIEEAREEEDKG